MIFFIATGQQALLFLVKRPAKRLYAFLLSKQLFSPRVIASAREAGEKQSRDRQSSAVA